MANLSDFGHYKLMFPSDYLEAVDLNGRDVTVTIKDIDPQFEFDAVEGKRPTKANKPLVTFEKAKKGWLLNVTNARSIAKLWGDDPNGWKGKAITVYPTTTRFGRDTVDCVRVRNQKPRPKPQPKKEDPEVTVSQPPEEQLPMPEMSSDLRAALSMIEQATTVDGVKSLVDRITTMGLSEDESAMAMARYHARLRKVTEEALAGREG